MPCRSPTPLACERGHRPSDADRRAPVVVRGGYADQRRAADAQLTEALAEWSERFPQVAVERLVVSDLDLACTIDRASHRGRLLVAGIGRHGRFAELLYGAGPVGLRGSTCPVALVPAGWPAPGAGGDLRPFAGATDGGTNKK